MRLDRRLPALSSLRGQMHAHEMRWASVAKRFISMPISERIARAPRCLTRGIEVRSMANTKQVKGLEAPAQLGASCWRAEFSREAPRLSLYAVIGIALLATLTHTLLLRADRTSFALSFGAFVTLVATQGLFWAFTYPVNAATGFWTVPPDSFEVARWQWEYSHAASAVLTFAALVAIVLAALIHNPSAERSSVRP